MRVTWTADGRADYYDLALFEVITGNGVRLEPRRAYRTRNTQAVDDDLLLRDHRYILKIATVIGNPNTATGDYGTVDYPVINASTVSTTFIAR